MLFRSFLKVYSDIIPLYQRRLDQGLEFINNIHYQADWSEEYIKDFLIKNYKILWIDTFVILEDMINKSQREDNTIILFYTFLKDFQYLLNNSYILSKTIISDKVFLESYFYLSNSFTFFENFLSRSNAIENDKEAPDYLKLN